MLTSHPALQPQPLPGLHIWVLASSLHPQLLWGFSPAPKFLTASPEGVTPSPTSPHCHNRPLVPPSRGPERSLHLPHRFLPGPHTPRTLHKITRYGDPAPRSSSSWPGLWGSQVTHKVGCWHFLWSNIGPGRVRQACPLEELGGPGGGEEPSGSSQQKPKGSRHTKTRAWDPGSSSAPSMHVGRGAHGCLIMTIDSLPPLPHFRRLQHAGNTHRGIIRDATHLLLPKLNFSACQSGLLKGIPFWPKRHRPFLSIHLLQLPCLWALLVQQAGPSLPLGHRSPLTGNLSKNPVPPQARCAHPQRSI